LPSVGGMFGALWMQVAKVHDGTLNVTRHGEIDSVLGMIIPLEGDKMNYVKEVKSDSKVEHVSVLLYVPSIGRFFSPNVSVKTPRLDAFTAAGGYIPDKSQCQNFYSIAIYLLAN